MNGAMARLAADCRGSGALPRSQSPMVTLLRKKREGLITAGALYIETDLTADGVMLKKSQQQQQQQQQQSNVILTSKEQHDVTTERTHKVNGRVVVSNSSSNDLPEKQKTVDEKIKEWNIKMMEIAAENNSSTTSALSRSPVRKVSEPSRMTPQRIEDYEPGRSSIAVREGSTETETYNPPIVKPGNFCRYTESDTEVEYRVRRRDDPLSPTAPDAHELYRSVQRGGQIPQHGIKIPLEPRIGHSLSFTSSQFFNPSRCVSEDRVAHMTRQERDRDNAERRKKMEWVVAEEKRKRLLATDRENAARRHCDHFMPSEKSLVPLNRYDDDEGRQMSNLPKSSVRSRHKLGSKVRGKARALYNFRAQTNRELSFRKGDYLYLLRQVDRNWFKGERHGVVGIFPVSYVEVITSLDEAQATAADGEGLARALYNFAAQTSLELSLRKGDVVKLVRRVDNNWYEGRFGNSRVGGIFPVRYVETLMEPSTPILTPASSRAVTPLICSPRVLSPTSSLYSMGPAPTIPSAPLSPAESELFDDAQFGSSIWLSSPSRWAANYRPASAASRHPHPRDPPRGDAAYYYSSSGLDGIGFGTRPTNCMQTSASMETSLTQNSFAKNVKSIARAYQFEERAENCDQKWAGSANNERAEVSTTKEDYSHLRYPPYRALYAYTPCSSDELQLATGDIIFVVERGADGWFVGMSERTKDFGTFPGNYVQLMR